MKRKIKRRVNTGTDATRYLLLRHIHPADDTDITWERLDEWYTANLVNGLGNFIARVMKMAESNLDDPVFVDDTERNERLILTTGLGNLIEEFKFNEALDKIWGEISEADKEIETKKPYRLLKSNPEEAKEIIRGLVKKLHRIAVLLEAFMPDTSQIIYQAIRENRKPDNLFPRLGE